MIDPIVEAVREKLKQRSQAGFLKYGTTLARGDLSRTRWLLHAQEEALDLANYLERLIQDEETAEKERLAYAREMAKPLDLGFWEKSPVNTIKVDYTFTT